MEMERTERLLDSSLSTHPGSQREGAVAQYPDLLRSEQLVQLRPPAAGESNSLQVLLNTSPDLVAGSDDGSCSWGEVLESMQQAQEDYSARSKTKVRSLAKNKAILVTLESLADFIPDQDGLGMLRSGLRLVFKLLQKRSENQEKILSAFEDIPLTFSRACEALATHPDDVALRRNVEDLLRILMDEIPKLVAILLRKHKGSLPRRLLKQHPEQEATIISHSVDSISKASQHVWNRVHMLLDKTVVQNLIQTRAVGAMVEETQVNVKALHGSIDAVQIAQSRIEQWGITRAEQDTKNLSSLATVIDGKIEDATSRLRAELQTLQTLLFEAMGGSHFLPAASMTQKALPGNRQFLTFEQPAQAVTSIAYCDLFSLLDLPDPLFLANDIDEVARQSNSQEKTMRRSSWLLVTDRFRSWLDPSHRASDIILVNGYLGHVSDGKISSLSVLCGLFSGIRKRPNTVVLHHFCGLHSHPDDPISGPRGMLRSLISQLVIALDQQHGGGVAVFSGMSEHFLRDAELQNPLALCLLFDELIRHLEGSTVLYCVLDNISEFETDLGGWEDQMCEIVGFVQDLVSRSGEGATLKVIMTASNRSIRICDEIETQDQISLNAGNELPHAFHHMAFEEDLEHAMLLS